MANVTPKGEPAGSVHRWWKRPLRYRGEWRLVEGEALSVVNDSRNLNRHEAQFLLYVQCASVTAGVYSSILCISVTSWSECFFLEIQWLELIMGLKSHRSRAVSVWSFTFISEITKKTQLWGQFGHLHVASFQTCSTKRGKLISGPCEIEYIPSQQNHWNEIILRLHRDDFTQFNRTFLTASDWDLNSGFHYEYYFFLKLMGRNQSPGCRLIILIQNKKKFII